MSAYAALHARIFSRLTVLVSGMVIGAIGTLSTVGYMVGIAALYQWDPNAQAMAPNTGLGFMLTGVAIAILGCSDRVWKYDDLS